MKIKKNDKKNGIDIFNQQQKIEEKKTNTDEQTEQTHTKHIIYNIIYTHKSSLTKRLK